MTTSDISPSKLNATQSDPDVRKSNGDTLANGHEALDLAAPKDHKIVNGTAASNEPASAPASPPGRASATATTDRHREAPAHGAIGSGREGLNGAKSMPGSRRTSGYGGTFGLEKLSLSVMEHGNTGGRRGWEKTDEEEDVDAEGAAKSVNYLGMGDDDFPAIAKSESKRLSAASAALDLAPLSQTPPRAFGSRPFETSLKTSEWPNFPPARGMTSPLPAQPATAAEPESLLGSRKASPTGMADSITSLPAMPSKSVPGTPFGLGGGMGVRRSGTSPNIADGLSQTQRGYSNPDLARAFGKVGGGFSMNDQARPYGADPLYSNMFNPVSAPLPPSSAVAGVFTPQAAYDPYGFSEEDGYGSGALYPGGSMGLKNKRADGDREFNRFTGVRIEDLAGELLSLCKDQHGCRYLQKQLEEGDPAHRDMIFRETFGHFPELMTDPFGNYLCQKLLEYSTDDQRNAIIESVANDLVGISLNMHGTRAVQKMVDFLAQPRQPKQIRTLIYALSMNVVALIKDLNGNHVIQKCLNKLIPEDNQFIYNAIASNLIEVATHRHGCCVLQRSIDHASPAQRVQLVTEIIFNSLYLVQDPFGNYVIQYILDLNDARFSEPLIRTFIGNVCSLSVQKFSSNVVEKCIRVADAEVRKSLVGEVLNRSRLEKLLRDSYGNYVIQTILDYCDINQRMVLVECIRPILPSIRNTPYGKRIQSKLAREDASFNYGPGFGGPGGPGGAGGAGGRGGYRGGGGGNFHRHLGRPQLQHINALTEVYGSQGGPFVPGYGMPPQHAPSFRPGPGPAPVAPDHTGMSYHAPGPDGQPWLHLRGSNGSSAGWTMPPDTTAPPHPHPQMPPSSQTDAAPMSAQATGEHAMWAQHGHQHGHFPSFVQQAAMMQ